MLAVFAGEATGPPAPVSYRRIPDPADDAERQIVVRSENCEPVWLLAGCGQSGALEYRVRQVERLAMQNATDPAVPVDGQL